MPLIDCHVHYKVHARDLQTNEEAMVQAAIAAGLDAIVFTEHHQRLLAERIAELNAKYGPFRVYSGIEVATDIGDVLVFGGDKCWPKGTPFRDIQEEAGMEDWLLCLAHPLRKGRPLPGLRPGEMNFIEVASRHTPEDYLSQTKIRLKAAEVSARFLSNSDAHKVKHFTDVRAIPTPVSRRCTGVPQLMPSIVDTLRQIPPEPFAFWLMDTVEELGRRCEEAERSLEEERSRTMAKW